MLDFLSSIVLFFYGQGAVGLAIWVPSVTNQPKETEGSDTKSLSRGYSFLSPVEDKNEENTWRQTDVRDGLELSVMGNGGNHEAIDEDIILEDLKVYVLPVFLFGTNYEIGPYCHYHFRSYIWPE